MYFSRANADVTLTVHLNSPIRGTAGLTGKRYTLYVAIPYLQITKPTLHLLILILERLLADHKLSSRNAPFYGTCLQESNRYLY